MFELPHNWVDITLSEEQPISYSNPEVNPIATTSKLQASNDLISLSI